MRWEGEVGEGTQTRQVGQEEESESEKVSNCAVRCCGVPHSAVGDRQTCPGSKHPAEHVKWNYSVSCV